MALEINELRSLLNRYEPDFRKLAAILQPDDLPQLIELVQGNERTLAARAAYAITLVHDEAAVAALDTAANSSVDTVRIAAASGLKHLKGFDVADLARRLLADEDLGVRKLAIKSAKALGLDALKPALEAVASNDAEPGLRDLANEALQA